MEGRPALSLPKGLRAGRMHQTRHWMWERGLP